MREMLLAFAVVVSLFSPFTASAAVTFYNNRAVWEAGTGNNFTNIGFYELGLPHDTQITNHYANLGVTFTDPSGDFLVQSQVFHDGWGLYGNLGGTVDMAFSQPMYAIAADMFDLKIQLSYHGELIYTSPFDKLGHVFAGVISDQPFDFVRFSTWAFQGSVYIDDLSFGPPIPAPGALALLACTAVIRGRSRRRSR